ncbi:universal stress protein PHOS32-like [Momordica charantia]|uniref:Universal stress protein PHOS32-like n=1 Tax=Momordica charantia TaxID=3673 RepID=A0A6J1CXL5_MOMCH|nr:universal stress protein PHOS32-like [Momordica charantia]
MATAAAEKPVIVIGVDDSECAFAALQWTLDHFFSQTLHPPLFKLVVVHAKPIPEVFVGVAGPGMVIGSAPGMYQLLDENLKKKAAGIIEAAGGICAAKSVSGVMFEVEEGDARNVLCKAVERHGASMLVVGSHGYGAIKRALLGSVSDYCARHAPCTVAIVKNPKTSA